MDAKEYDGKRDEYFRAFRYKIVRFWNNEVNTNLEGVLMKLVSELKD